MKTLTVTLKQHTPLIHFQHDQYGATLRASEVKPKLDRFIIEKLCRGKDTIDYKKVREEHKGWFIGEEDTYALNYKMKIVSGNIDESIYLNQFSQMKYIPKKCSRELYHFTDSFPLLLSNMGGKSSEDDLVNFSYTEFVVLKCIFFEKIDSKSGKKIDFSDLITLMEKEVTAFFANANWGQRKDKGFGSFTVVDINGTKVTWNPKEMYDEGTQLMQYEVNTNGFEKMENLFSVIDFYWKLLKSGINYTTRDIDFNNRVTRRNPEWYYKSYLWTYLNNKGYTWEKRKVKTDLNLESTRLQTDVGIVINNNPAFFARAQLGCPIDGFTYKIPQGRVARNRDGEMKMNRRGKVEEEKKTVDIVISNNRDIKRIASPIILKPVFYRKKKETGEECNVVSIYILYDKDIIKALHDTENAIFTFKRKGGEDLKSELPLFLKDNATNENIFLDYHDLICQYHRSFRHFKMVARYFNWNNILNGKEISLLQIKK